MRAERRSSVVSDRGLQVLRVIVQDYVASREPVGSKSIVEHHSFGVSAATIRNDMALLEEEDLIVAPHTSSGRVPTDSGYRVYVDRLADLRPITSAQKQAIETFLGDAPSLDDVLVRTVRLLSQLTNQVALVQYPSLDHARILHVEFVALDPRRLISILITNVGRVEQSVVELTDDIDAEFLIELRNRICAAAVGHDLVEAANKLGTVLDDFAQSNRSRAKTVVATLVDQICASRPEKLVMAGTANLVRTEDDFSGSVSPVLDAIEEQVALLTLFSEMASDQHGVSVSIGHENTPMGLKETSVLASGYRSSGGDISTVGVIGPTRMDYPNNMAAVRAVARYLSRVLDQT